MKITSFSLWGWLYCNRHTCFLPNELVLSVPCLADKASYSLCLLWLFLLLPGDSQLLLVLCSWREHLDTWNRFRLVCCTNEVIQEIPTVLVLCQFWHKLKSREEGTSIEKNASTKLAFGQACGAFFFKKKIIIDVWGFSSLWAAPLLGSWML